MTEQANAATPLVSPGRESGYVTLSQIAIRTGRHPELLRQWCAAGRLPCARVGGSWVMLERDVALIDGIASRSRRSQATAPVGASVPPALPTADRVLAAVFDDAAVAGLAAQAIVDRLGAAAEEVGAAPLDVPALPALSLTVVGGRFVGRAAIEARRILAAFGGRVIADVEEIRVTTDASAATEVAQRPESG